jgi:hypothetical protein
VARLATRLAEAEAALATLDEAVGREPRSLMERDSAILRGCERIDQMRTYRLQRHLASTETRPADAPQDEVSTSWQ